MTKETSIFLDLVRFSAALTVVFGHIGGDPKIAGSILWQFSSLANVAVIIFFVLSGYVVDYATQRRETDGVSFTSARATRILSVAVPALALTALLDSIGSAVNPVLYAHYHSLSWDRLIASLTFLNEAWGVDLTPGSNLPVLELRVRSSLLCTIWRCNICIRRTADHLACCRVPCFWPKNHRVFPHVAVRRCCHPRDREAADPQRNRVAAIVVIGVCMLARLNHGLFLWIRDVGFRSNTGTFP